MLRKQKWLIAGLVLSILLNIFFAGAFLGKSFKKPEERYRQPPLEFNLKKLSQYLDPEEKIKVKKLLKSQREDLRKNFKDLRQSEKKIVKLIVADTVDRDALRKALEEHGNNLQKMHAPLQDILLEVIVNLDKPARMKLGEDLFLHRIGRDGRPDDVKSRRLRMKECREDDTRECPSPPSGPMQENM